jgi:hypothetical protein
VPTSTTSAPPSQPTAASSSPTPPSQLEKKPLPADFVEPPPPADIKTNEELYLTGLRMEQFHSATGDPNLYWNEALRRDPDDIRVNTVLGIDAIKAGRYVPKPRPTSAKPSTAPPPATPRPRTANPSTTSASP